MRSLPVSIIIIPDKKIGQKARKLGKVLAENFEYDYTVANTKFIPHVTIYQAQFPVKNLEKIKDILENLNLKPFEVSIGPFHSHHGFIWWNILENENLTKLHHRMLKELNPLREGLLLFHLTLTGYKTGEKFTKEEAENVRKYGAVIVDKLFQPHITLAKLKCDVEEQRLYEILGKVEYKFKISDILIGEMGNHGTVIKILGEYPMKTLVKKRP